MTYETLFIVDCSTGQDFDWWCWRWWTGLCDVMQL